MTAAHAWTSALDPAGPQAAHEARLFWFFFGVTGVVFVVVLAALALAIAASRKRRDESAHERQARDRRAERFVSIGIVTTVVILFVLLISSVRTGRLLASLQSTPAVSVSVIGHRWWWEVTYDDQVAGRRVLTANELHIPTGQPIAVSVTSRDVIHSFWVPALQGKRDLIPGYTTTLWLQADRPGLYHGQCAEFCGRQHARMAIDVVAESGQEFSAWLDRQRQPAQPPSTDTERRGRDVFVNGTCATCHTITGTRAHGQLAPDLTHIASRARLASATIPNLPGHLAEWIRNPQSFKPGSEMPPQMLAADDLEALRRYLESLE